MIYSFFLLFLLILPIHLLALGYEVLINKDDKLKTYLSPQADPKNISSHHLDFLIEKALQPSCFIYNLKENVGCTGFFITSDGYILTVKHGIEKRDCKDCRVLMANKHPHKISLVGVHPIEDVAILKVTDYRGNCKTNAPKRMKGKDIRKEGFLAFIHPFFGASFVIMDRSSPISVTFKQASSLVHCAVLATVMINVSFLPAM